MSKEIQHRLNCLSERVRENERDISTANFRSKLVEGCVHDLEKRLGERFAKVEEEVRQLWRSLHDTDRKARDTEDILMYHFMDLINAANCQATKDRFLVRLLRRSKDWADRLEYFLRNRNDATEGE